MRRGNKAPVWGVAASSNSAMVFAVGQDVRRVGIDDAVKVFAS